MASLAMTPRNLITDQFALLEFKDYIRDPHHVLSNNWTTSISVCDWFGVFCGVNHKRVISLDLSNMSLTGTIPPHLGNLSFLVYLDMSSNNFHGHLPKELGQLHRLRLIDLTINRLSGNLPDDLCHHLPKLEIFALSKNQFSGQIPSSIGQCSNLQMLSLSYNSFTGLIPRSIGNLTMMKEVYLGLNNLKGEIPEEMGNLLSLKTLYAGNMGLTGRIPSSIFNITSLNYVVFNNNSLSGNIPSSIGQCYNLMNLSLNMNQFTGLIPKSIENLTMLKKFEAVANYLEEFGLAGFVSVKCDIYSYGILLIETFTKKKPTDEFFTDAMTMRHWVKMSLSSGIIDIVDANLLTREDEYFIIKANCISSIMELALVCSAELPEERKDMKDVVAMLKKIKQKFLNNIKQL